MMGDPGHSMDLPFEDGPGGELPDEHVHYSGGVVVMAATVDVPDRGKQPAVVFWFATPLGEFYPAIVLVQDDEQMAKLRTLINEADAAARRAAA